LASRQPVIVKDLPNERRFSGAPLLLDHGIVSGATVVIPGSDRPLGVLGAHSVRSVTFQPEQINFLASVAYVLSQAIGQRRSEAAIQRSESWLRHLVATTQDAVVSIDRRGCVVLFNASAERIFGYTAGEIVGRKVNLLMAEPYASEHDGYVARYERTREPHAIGRIRKVTAKRKDGTEFPIELSVTEIEVDEEVHYAAFLRDVSETLELHARAVENERLAAIGGTAATIGHEIANPLNGIILHCNCSSRDWHASRPPTSALPQISSRSKGKSPGSINSCKSFVRLHANKRIAFVRHTCLHCSMKLSICNDRYARHPASVSCLARRLTCPRSISTKIN
jgi:PAS domain S-box-containing protein